MDLLVSGLIAGLASLLATFAVERFGGIVGGVIAYATRQIYTLTQRTVPSTLTVVAIALSMIETSEYLDLSMRSVPVGL